MPIEVNTIEGLRDGVNLAKPINDLDDTEARYLYDFLLDEETLLTQRGPVSGDTAFALDHPSGCVSLQNANGQSLILAAGANASTSEWRVFSFTGAGAPQNEWSHDEGTRLAEYELFDAKPALGGGVWMGTSGNASSTDTEKHRLVLYKGGLHSANTYTTGTITGTRGSKTITGSSTVWTSAHVGMFLWVDVADSNNATYIGEVASVSSNTVLLLKDNNPYTITAGSSYTLRSFKPFRPLVAKGRISTSTTSTTVTGAGTKFKDQMTSLSAVWNIYDKDWVFVGKVSSIANNTGLTLTANAAVALSNERFYGLPADIRLQDDTELDAQMHPGWLNAVYASRQWYGYRNRLYYSETFHPEAVDFSPVDGDFIDIVATEGADSAMQAIMPSFNCLLALKETEVHGVFGSTPSQFQVKKLGSDGCIATGSVQAYDSGVLWAGRRGIYFYDGTSVENITKDKLGEWYERGVATFDPTTNRMGSAIVNNHYLLFIDTVTPTRGVKKLTVDTVPTQITIAINLKNRAITFLSNLSIYGSARVVSPATYGTALLLRSGANAGVFIPGEELFNTTGTDTTTCYLATSGPKPYIESKKYHLGDPQLKKLFKQIQAHHKVVGGALTLETIVGMSDTGTASLSTFADTGAGTFKNKRIKFLKRSQYLAFRLYSTSTLTECVLGPFGIGFKWQRPGRT